MPTGFAVIIPTRNRKELLSGLLENLALASNRKIEIVIVVDSSDDPLSMESEFPFEFHHIHTRIQSAAIQRNIGIDVLIGLKNTPSEFITFLDDDVRVPLDYFVRIETVFKKHSDAIGLSGITDGLTEKKCQFVRKAFGLCSDRGKISRGGINVPCWPEAEQELIQVDWLIGCSSWRFQTAKNFRFETDFMESSLFEDVIYSYSISRIGNLYVDTSLFISHLESKIGRQSIAKHYSSLIVNRQRLFQKFPNEFRFKNYWLANVGLLIVRLGAFLSGPSRANMDGIVGVLLGILRALRS